MRRQTIDFAALHQAVQQLLGLLVQQSRTDDPTSHIFTLHFGPAPAADQPFAAVALNGHCAWRIVEAGNILCAWQESIEGYAEPALQALVGQQIAAVALSEFGDLSIRFTSGRALQLWNDIPYEEGDSWLLSFPGQGEYALATRNWFTYNLENSHSF